MSQLACASAIEVLAANGVDVMLAAGDEYTPTPAISPAIVVHKPCTRRSAGRWHHLNGFEPFIVS